MKLKKVILFFTVGAKVSAEQLALGKSVGAQFRNASLMDPENPEPCDFVMGDAPECYRDIPVFGPEQAAEALKSLGGDTLPPQGENGPQTGSEDASGTSETDTGDDTPPESTENPENDEEEITLEYLEGLDKGELLELAEEENIGLTTADKKSAPKLRAAIADHFDLQA